MSKPFNPIDFSATVFLCLLGFGSITLVWIAGTPGYGFLSNLWRNFGVVNLFVVSLLCFTIAAAVVRRTFIIGSARRNFLLGLLLLTSLPTVLFAMVLCGKAILLWMSR